jgi:hypothetical protein
MKKHDQDGFAHVVALLVVVIVALAGFMGWYVWHAQHVNKTTPSTTTTSISAQPTQKYLAIIEWGVKVPLSSIIDDAYYYIGSSGSAYLSLESLKSVGECAADKISVGAYFRFTAEEKDGRSGDTWLSEIPLAPKVDSYYYSYARAQSYCSDDETVRAKETAASDAFNKAIQSAVVN